MGYFSNGEEGDRYKAQYCERCIHGQDPEFGPCVCPINTLHAIYNYDQFKPIEPWPTVNKMLTALIPRDENSLFNERCAMFHEQAMVDLVDPAVLLDLVEKVMFNHDESDTYDTKVLVAIGKYLKGDPSALKKLAGEE